MKAIGIIRVSVRKGREGESFASPVEQRERIVQWCDREGLKLLRVEEELDVSGGTDLAKRKGLRSAVEAVEAGEAKVIVAAYFDRFFRSIKVQAEVVERVEQAGGKVLALDIGEVTGDDDAQWLQSSVLGFMSEHYRRTIRKRAGAAQKRSVARGVCVYPNTPLGYARNDDGTLSPHPVNAPTVAEAFTLRAAGASLQEIKDTMRAKGMDVSWHQVQKLFQPKSRTVLGELHFGKLSNLEAWKPIVDPDTYARALRMIVPKGRRGQSDRLLARLGILRCASCDRAMVVGVVNNSKKFYTYRCPPNGGCERRSSIGAEKAEQVVSDAVKAALADVEGRASVAENAAQVVGRRDDAQAELDGALRSFTAAGLANEPAAVERLAELGKVRDERQAHVDELGGSSADVILTVADWDDLTLEERRALIRATVKQAVVSKSGQGAGRITVELFSD
jgi:DNA invertase Pin-like site-specific DNA recombinase